MMLRSWAVIVLAGLDMACVSRAGATTGSALVHPQFPYSVTYDDEKKKSLLGDEWLLENYRQVTRESPDPDGNIPIERKDGYEEEYELDFDDDDKTDARVTLQSPDLLLIHKKTNARIEVTTLLLDKRLAEKELRVLLGNVVDRRAGTRSLFAGFDGAAAGVERRMAARQLESGPASLDKQVGLAATIERADLDQLELDPQARWRRSRIFMLHMPFDYYAVEPSMGEPQAKRRHHKYRVLMLAEYSNSTEDFEAQYPDFVRLLNKIHLLSDDMLLDYLAEPLSQCRASGSAEAGVASGASATAGAGTAVLRLSISEVGFPSVTEASGLTRACAESAVIPFRFAATSVTRNAERAYDFSKPLKPAWLTQGTYVEERAPSAPKPAESAVDEPEAAAPAPTEPAATPTNVGETPPTPPGSSQSPATPESAPGAPAP